MVDFLYLLKGKRLSEKPAIASSHLIDRRKTVLGSPRLKDEGGYHCSDTRATFRRESVYPAPDEAGCEGISGTCVIHQTAGGYGRYGTPLPVA
jgi:hypothetical protein